MTTTCLLLVWCSCWLWGAAVAFVTPPWPSCVPTPSSSLTAVNLWDKFLAQTKSAQRQPQDDLKDQLFELLSSRPERSRVEELIDQLANVSPTPQSASSPLLQRTFRLIYTTEKEINFFLNNGLSETIYQTIKKDGTLLNSIPFVNGGGSFTVTGRVVADASSNPTRTLFEFERAVLDVGRWGTYTLPPVGKGWFDTIYLDESLRIDTNSRNDLLICVPEKVEE